MGKRHRCRAGAEMISESATPYGLRRWRAGFEKARRVEIRELRRMTVTEKLRRTLALMDAWHGAQWPDRSGEGDAIRARWGRLREALGDG